MPKCVIKAKDLCLHQISVIVPGFLIADPNPKGIPKIALPSERAIKEEATSSQLLTKEEEGIIEVFDSKDDFEVFNQLLSPETPSSDLSHPPPEHASQAQGDSPLPEDIGIQRKSRRVF